MDTITQGLLGAVVGEALYGSKLGRKALLFGGLCGLLPDLDILGGLFSQWSLFLFHRSWTHSLPVLVFMAPLIGLVGWKIWGRGSQKSVWVGVAFWALITHPLLDLFTSFGTRLFYPFLDTRFAIDAIAAIDPFYSVPLFVVFILGCRSRSKRPVKVSRMVLFATSAYIALGWFVGFSGRTVVLKELHNREPAFCAVECRPTPVIGTVFLRRMVIRDSKGGFRVCHYSPFHKGAAEFKRVEALDSVLVKKALASERGSLFREFSQGMVCGRLKDDGRGVVLEDMRYGSLTRPLTGLFFVEFEFSPQGEVVKAVPGDRKLDLDYSAEFKEFARLIF